MPRLFPRDARSYISTSLLLLLVGTGLMIFSHPSGDFLIQTAVLLMIHTVMTQSLYLLHPVHSPTTKSHYLKKNEVLVAILMALKMVRKRKPQFQTCRLEVLLARRKATTLCPLPPLATRVQRATTKRNAIVARMGITRRSSAMKS